MECYEIFVKGHIDARRLSMFERIEVIHLPSGMTHLLARIKDQSELYSILTQIRDMGIPLIKLELQEKEK